MPDSCLELFDPVKVAGHSVARPSRSLALENEFSLFPLSLGSQEGKDVEKETHDEIALEPPSACWLVRGFPLWVVDDQARPAILIELHDLKVRTRQADHAARVLSGSCDGDGALALEHSGRPSKVDIWPSSAPVDTRLKASDFLRGEPCPVTPRIYQAHFFRLGGVLVGHPRTVPRESASAGPFMAHIVMPDGPTVGQHVSPGIEEAYRTGRVPLLLPAAAE